MNTRLPLGFATLALLAAPALAQITTGDVQSIVGPPQAPIGCPVSISISNDSNQGFWMGVCPWQVLKGSTPVFSPICIQIAKLLSPGETFSTEWHQNDDFGNPVPPGKYTVRVFLPTGIQQDHLVQIGGTDAGMAALGIPKIGTTRNYQLCSPLDPNGFYLVLASGSNTTGIPTCGGTVPLDADDILLTSVSDPTIFQNSFGNLDGNGRSDAMALAIPPLPSLVGLDLVFAFIVIDFTDPFCGIRRISAPLKLQIS